MTIAEDKAALRQAVRERRRTIPESEAAAAGPALVRHFHAHLSVKAGAVVSGYWPGRYEIDVRPLMIDLAGRGHPLALPVVVEHGRPLLFRSWKRGDPVEKGNSAQKPLDDAPEAVPDFLLVPLIAFDRSGGRLGQGAGFYDRTLEALRRTRPVRAIGIAYAMQEVDSVPLDPYDQRLDGILTENGFLQLD